MRGRCLPYGEGITYWPVVEVLKQLDVLPPDPEAASAIRSLLGAAEAASSAEEIAWAFRKTLEHAAAAAAAGRGLRRHPLGARKRSSTSSSTWRSSPPARRSCFFAWRGPSWSSAGRPGRSRCASSRCAEPEVERLIPETIDDSLRERIARAAGGNPLFIGEMLAMAGDGEVVVPPTLQALLAARLDRLEEPERAVLECAAVEGEIFHRGAVQALVPDEPQVTPRLAGWFASS